MLRRGSSSGGGVAAITAPSSASVRNTTGTVNPAVFVSAADSFSAFADFDANTTALSSISPGGEFIAGGGGKDSCFGDSGGPVYLDTPRGTVVVGAVSRGLDGAATPCRGGGIY